MFRAKVKIESAIKSEHLFDPAMSVKMRPVTNGSPEDNTYSKWTPSGEISLYITNPDIFPQLEVGKIFYVDFTEA